VDIFFTVIFWIALAAVIIGVLLIGASWHAFGEDSDKAAGAGCLTVCLGICFIVGSLKAPDLWKHFKAGHKHDEMMKSCFEVEPALETTLNNMQAEIDKWLGSKEKFINMRDAVQTGGGRSLADKKLARIDEVLNELKLNHEKVLEQVEMIALESAGQFTDLDKKALEDLSRKVESSIRDAQELRKGLTGD